MTGIALGALVAGLVGSPHCVGMCGGFASACADPARDALAWHAGRWTTYAVLGALAGGFGGLLLTPGVAGVADVLAAGLTLAFALALAGVIQLPEGPALPGLTGTAAALLRRPGALARYGFGLTTGLLPCGLVYATLGLAVASGGALQGAGTLLAFGLGTTPLLAGASIGLRRLVARSVHARRALAALVLAAGWGAIAQRSVLLHGPVGTDGWGDAPVCAQP